MSESTEDIQFFANTPENEGTLLKGLSDILSLLVAELPNIFGTLTWTIIKAQWTIVTSSLSSLRIPVCLLISAPEAIYSFIVAPIHLISCLPGAIRLLFKFIFYQLLAIIGYTSFIALLPIGFIIYRATEFGQGVSASWKSLFWIPICSTTVIVLTNLGPLRELVGTLSEFFSSSPWSAVFLFLFVFKFLKIVVHLFSYIVLHSYKLPPLHPTVLPSDVTVIIPSIGDFGAEFIETVESVLANNPAKIIISTVGTKNLIQARRVVEEIMRTQCLPGRTIEVVAIHQPSKRAQCVHASLIVKTDIIAYADDHVIWLPTFLHSALAELEDPCVGIVGTCKRVIRDPGKNWSDSIRNLIACLYLERHNFEMTATYNIDGGVWVISGRTCLVRTDIMQSIEYRQEFLSETFLGVGPVGCDDDNFTTRYMLNHGWKTAFHNRPEAMIYTTLGTAGGWTKFTQQLLRWARSTWRSYSKTLFIDGQCWKAAPWTTYSMFTSGLFNIAIIYDPLLFISLFQSDFYSPANHAGAYLAWVLLLSKLTKTWHFHMRNKKDMIWTIPVGILFSYIHGLIRLVALLTCRDITWGGRDLSVMEHPRP
ncbi:hypothetical protein DSL72_008429 [Monilinia vaccinii-corymbosi]|uniref:Glycosyltransferase 2-like domain-containing protein n=1 Tax=Monilinia vaccinii-corymbosi TaxID=61207 RepID=A0A8A3PKP9_9HELO|nr:hypothetical protein DSL72_008429 [Monilinia vaccinii-corymbosi]